MNNQRKPFRKKPVKSAPKPSVDDGTMRLNKYIAHAGIASRREADNLIKAGVVEVNGTVITEMGYKVGEDDIVRYEDIYSRK